MGLNQFHDILPGSAIAWVHRQARADYVRDIARLRDIAAEAGASIASVRDDADNAIERGHRPIYGKEWRFVDCSHRGSGNAG